MTIIEPTLNPIEKEILCGTLLGDAHLQSQNNWKTARLVCSQGGKGDRGLAHKRYLYHLFRHFKGWCNQAPTRVNRPNQFAQWGREDSNPKPFLLEQGHIQHRFFTLSYPQFVSYGSCFYRLSHKGLKDIGISLAECQDLLRIRPNPEGIGSLEQLPPASSFYWRKTVPENIADLLTARGLAYWYMDDGSIKDRQSGACLLNTQSFTFHECMGLCEALNLRFGLGVSIRHKRRSLWAFGHQIYIPGRGNRLRNLVEPYYYPPMAYKLPRQTTRPFRLGVV